MKPTVLLALAALSAAPLFADLPAPAAVEIKPVFNEVSFAGDYVTFAEAKPKFRPVHQAQPVYPEAFLREGIEGYAVVAFLVGLDGVPQQCQVVEATDAAFGEAARHAITQWRFTPPEFRGKTGPILMKLPIDFSLGEDLPTTPPADAPKVASR